MSPFYKETSKSLKHFKTTKITFPWEVIDSLLLIKLAAATANYKLKFLTLKEFNSIKKAVVFLRKEKDLSKFPLVVWQTGSGTQTNMNVNEVVVETIFRQSKITLHPNNHINMHQSTNDVFPTAMNLSALSKIPVLEAAIEGLIQELRSKEKEFKNIKKIGRTHFMDAVPYSCSEEINTFRVIIESHLRNLKLLSKELLSIPLGGSAVGNGVNVPRDFSKLATKELSKLTKLPLKSLDNKAQEMSIHNAIGRYNGEMKNLAVSLIKITNDLRFLSSGPRSGIGELNLPNNEAGSSIMPGKVNPTQAEALSMICFQVVGQELVVSLANAGGHLQMNVYKPVIIYNTLLNMDLLAGGISGFTEFGIKGLTLNLKTIRKNLDNSLMLITLLAPEIGYDLATEIVKLAIDKDISIRDAATEKGIKSSLINKLLR